MVFEFMGLHDMSVRPCERLVRVTVTTTASRVYLQPAGRRRPERLLTKYSQTVTPIKLKPKLLHTGRWDKDTHATIAPLAWHTAGKNNAPLSMQRSLGKYDVTIYSYMFCYMLSYI